MTTFAAFLTERLEAGGFTTEDALACFLPLVRQVAAAHKAGLVAPLEGISALHVENGRTWFEESLLRKASLQSQQIQALEQPATRAVEVVGQYRVDLDADHGADAVVSLQAGRRGDVLTQPVYLPGYVSWEHEVGHHDPLTDTFVLGLIFASLTCRLDLHRPEQLESFIQHRRNLFELNPTLHPVLAKAVVRMTELNRHRRPQDLSALLRTLENYRDQDIDFEFDLARMPNWQTADRPGRRALILSCLQQRLFEISRRNRLLHFRATTQTVNLTWASMPLSFDVKRVRPEQILTWDHDYKKAVAAGGPISLNKYLRFEEALYLPGQLDVIRNEARRDQTEYGFAQLRLVVCFLRWANLKEKPPERFDSPLVLLPVRLSKTKGVRDVYTLEPLSTEAEINPVLRFYLKQLYGVDLPEQVDLASSSLDELHAYVAGKVQASEPGVAIDKIDRPRINLIHARAQRRLDQYRRRTRLSGRGVRSFQDLDYSYDRDNYHPLGLRLFQTRVRTPEPQLRTVVEETPRPRTYMQPAVATPETQKERHLFAQMEEETNPYRWEFDLCNVTLGNFHYRKMSLVRDYAVLLDRSEDQPSFDAIFSLQPRQSLSANPAPLPLAESYAIVNCDPTQASALALARTGCNFIIQGPPGTGKSQTITNLIADFVAQGKRVLFVCEKRAAIDVVYHRLHQAGLQELCCLIHDSQDDKKEFIQDLKQTYENFLSTQESQSAKSDAKRQRLLDSLNKELAPLEHYQVAMQASAPQAGIPLWQLLQRSVELRDRTPDLPPRIQEQVPLFKNWQENRERILRIQDRLQVHDGPTILAKHPLKRLHSRFAVEPHPLETIHQLLPRVDHVLDQVVSELEALTILPSPTGRGAGSECRDVPPSPSGRGAGGEGYLPAESWNSLERIRQLAAYAGNLEFLGKQNLLTLLNGKSDLSKKLAGYRKTYQAKQLELSRARVTNKSWRQKLAPEETKGALELARALEQSGIWRFVKPAWWRLRSLLNRSYTFHDHKVEPTWTQVLEKLLREHQIEAAAADVEAEARQAFSFDGSFLAFATRITELIEAETKLPSWLREVQRNLVSCPQGNEIVLRLAKLQPLAAQLSQELDTLLEDALDLTPGELRDEVALIEESLDEFPDFQPCLKELAALPAPLASAWRRLALHADELEAAMAGRTLDDLWRADPALARFNRSVLAGHVGRLEEFHDQWHDVNAGAVRDRVCRAFLEHVRISSLPHAQLSEAQKEFKTLYNRGRRELEHEFGKTMRFRSIRDLVGGNSKEVLSDLKPVWLMSPLSVSDALPLTTLFDVVIFDEASQVTLEEAVPAIFRARQVLVVGDEMQLPPTSFFSSKQTDDEERLLVEDSTGQEVEYDLSSNSFLNHAARNLPATMLGWHYRSRSESLISFSNAAFYQGRLLTVPEVKLPAAEVREILVPAPEDGAGNVERLLERPVSFHFLEKGIYENRRNPSEANYIAHLVRGLLARDAGLSIGIVAFSEAQQAEIEQALQQLAGEDDGFRDRLDAEWEREQDGQFVGLLVKNLENIQGDERDVIILSVCYGHGPSGKMLMNFGPINQSGGERRLNVAFSRAKQHMVLVCSIRHHAITNDYNDGARALKNYLRYAEALSAGDLEAARRVLWEINPAHDPRAESASNHIVITELMSLLGERGWHVDTGVGQSHFRCDLAVRGKDERQYRLGILVDTDAYYRNDNLLERDVLRPRLLRSFGWTTHVVLTKDWFENHRGVLQTIEAMLSGTPDKADAAPESPEDAARSENSNWKSYLETTDASRKFWEIRVAGNQHTVRFGRVGTAGQTKSKTFTDAKSANRDARRLLEEKLAKGFVEKRG